MSNFIVAFLVASVILAALALPLVFASRRDSAAEHRSRMRKAALAGVVIGLTCALASAGSSKLTGDCADAGNSSCNDYGGTGIQAFLIIGFGLVVLAQAWSLRESRRVREARAAAATRRRANDN